MLSKFSTNKGITLLELLTIIAIVSIIAIIALPIYLEYSIRAQVSEGVNIMGTIKPSVTEAYFSAGTYPSTNEEAGIAPASDYATENIRQIYVGSGGVITVEFSLPGLGSNNLLSFEPNDTGAGLIWECRAPASGGIENRYLSPDCRS